MLAKLLDCEDHLHRNRYLQTAARAGAGAATRKSASASRLVRQHPPLGHRISGWIGAKTVRLTCTTFCHMGGTGCRPGRTRAPPPTLLRPPRSLQQTPCAGHRLRRPL